MTDLVTLRFLHKGRLIGGYNGHAIDWYPPYRHLNLRGIQKLKAALTESRPDKTLRVRYVGSTAEYFNARADEISQYLDKISRVTYV